MSFLETYMVPVCCFELREGEVRIARFYGTAFFINGNGVFLSASHVVETAAQDADRTGGTLGLCVRHPERQRGNIMSAITAFDPADPPYDVCVGQAEESFGTLLTLGESEISTWKDVATFGYPSSAVETSLDEYWMYGRGFKGYVHRTIGENQGRLRGHPDAFELSFPVPSGFSGAPLFVSSQPKDIAVGVCVGVNRTEEVEFMHEEIQEDGQLSREKRTRMEEYGIAHDIRDLGLWVPPSLGGLTLRELSPSC